MKLEMEVIKQPAEAKRGAGRGLGGGRGVAPVSARGTDVLASFRGSIRAPQVRVSAVERVARRYGSVDSHSPAPGEEALGHAHPFILC